MFAGIVEGMATIVRLGPPAAASGNRRLEIDLGEFLAGCPLGASIAINGTCLTLAASDGTVGGFDVVPETLRLTNLGELRPGDRVNIERSLRVGDRIDGHFVQGHIDGIGTVISNGMEAGEWRIRVRSPQDLMKFIVRKGSITIDGTSLTVVDVDDDRFSVALIPTTLERTVLGTRKAGDRVNLETDVLARMVVTRLEAFLERDGVPVIAGVAIEHLKASAPA